MDRQRHIANVNVFAKNRGSLYMIYQYWNNTDVYQYLWHINYRCITSCVAGTSDYSAVDCEQSGEQAWQGTTEW